MALTIVNGPVIEAGQALSNGIDISAGRIVRITTPAAWTPAHLTFQISTDGLGYNDLFDALGGEALMVIGPNRAVLVPPALSAAFHFIKFRSGTLAFPTLQVERREFAMTLETEAPA